MVILDTLFSRPAAEIIADYCIVPRLSISIPAGPILKCKALYANPCAMEAGLLKNPNLDDRDIVCYLGTNPAAMDIIRANSQLFLHENSGGGILRAGESTYTGWLWENSAAVDWLLEEKQAIDWKFLSKNTGRRAIELMRANPKKIDAHELAQNPASRGLRYDLIALDPDKFYYFDHPFANPEKIDRIKEILPPRVWADWRRLCANPRPWAVDYMCEHWDNISVHDFAGNPGIFKSERDQLLVNLLRSL